MKVPTKVFLVLDGQTKLKIKKLKRDTPQFSNQKRYQLKVFNRKNLYEVGRRLV